MNLRSNLDICLLVNEKGIHYKDIAAVLGVHKGTVSRMMDKKLSPKQRDQILYAIDCIERGIKTPPYHEAYEKTNAGKQLQLLQRDNEYLKGREYMKTPPYCGAFSGPSDHKA